MTRIEQSQGCCAIYEMFELYPIEEYNLNSGKYQKLTMGAMFDKMVARAKEMSRPAGHLPLLIVFSDADNAGHGEKWKKFLVEKGYRVDSIKLGKNPKSNNNVTLYHWYTNKKKNDERPKAATSKPRRNEGPRNEEIQRSPRRRGTGFLGLKRRTDT